MAETFDIKELDVMEPKMMVSDDLKVIYINEAFEEKLNAGSDEEKTAYEKMQADHPGYVTRLRRMQITLEQMKRFAQLINKSNQFNLRTIRYSEEQLLAMKDDGIHRLIYVDLNDKFSSYGIISCIILEKRGEDCFIDTWLMSCRVLKRGVENLALDTVVTTAKEMGCSRLIGEYIPTAKNKMVENFYPSLGFGSLGDGLFELTLEEYSKKEYFIQIVK